MDRFGLTKVHNPFENFIKNVLVGIFFVFVSVTAISTSFFGLNNLSDKNNEVNAVTYYSFNVTGDGGIDSISVNGASSGGFVEALTEITVSASLKPGYEFDGWTGTYTSSSSSFTFIIKKNTTLTANSIALPTYEVTISVDSSEGTVSGAGTYYEGQQVTISASPKTGYEFTNWSGSYGGTSNPYSFTITEAKSFTANFQPKTYTVSISKDSGILLVTGAGTYEYGEQVTIQAYAKTGYDFDDWSGSYSGSSNPYSFTINGNKSFTANSKLKTYTIYAKAYHFDSSNPEGYYASNESTAGSVEIGNNNNADYYTSKTVNYGSSWYYSANPNISDGWIFLGWYDSSSFTNKIASASSYQLTNISSSTTLYAKFAKKYKVRIILTTSNPHATGSDSNFWIFSQQTSPYGYYYVYDKYIAYGLTVGTLPDTSAFSREGYSFSNFGGLTESTVVLTDSSYITQWTAPQTTINLNHQGGGGALSSVTATYEEPMPSIVIPTKTGYSFQGYYTGTIGSGTQYYTASGDSAKNWDKTDSTYTLYAYWIIKDYTITFDSNEGSSVNSITQEYNTSIDLASYQPARTGFVFDGWYTDENWTTKVETYIFTEDITLHAKWNPIPEIVSFTGNEENGGGVYPGLTYTYTVSAVNANTYNYSVSTTSGSYNWENSTTSTIYSFEPTNNTTYYLAVKANGTYAEDIKEITVKSGTAISSAHEDIVLSPTNTTKLNPQSRTLTTILSDHWVQYFYTILLVTNTSTGQTIQYSPTNDATWSAGDNANFSFSPTSAGTYYARGAIYYNDISGGSGYVYSNASKLVVTVISTDITLDQYGGQDGSSSVTATYEESMPPIIIPTKIGYSFQGYYALENGGGTQYYTASGASARNWDKTDSTYTLYAYWTVASYTLYFDANGGEEVDSITQQYNTQVDLSEYETTREGYLFDGWYTDESWTTKVDAYTFTENKTLYAKWLDADYWTDYASGGFSGGSGTSSSPYLIASAGQLAKLAKDVNNGNSYDNKYFKLTTNISLSAHEWYPIGIYKTVSSKPFEGNFDGNGYTISGMRISVDSGLQGMGLFGYTNNAYIHSLTLTGSINLETNKNIYVGGLVGHNISTDIKYVEIKVDIDVETSVSIGVRGAIVGGISGGREGSGGSNVSYSYYKGDIDVSADGDIYVGGIAGTLSSGSYIFASGDITVDYIYSAVLTKQYVGGIAGSVFNLNQGYSRMSINIKNSPASSAYGSLVGIVSGSADIEDFYYYPSYGSGSVIGSGDSNVDLTNVAYKPSSEWTNKDNFSYLNFNYWVMSTNSFNQGRPTLLKQVYVTTFEYYFVPIGGYLISFNENNGNGITYEIAASDSGYDSIGSYMPPDPTKENYVFAGWANSSITDVSNRDSSTNITQGETWYAVWDATITFDYNYDNLGTYQTVDVSYNYSIYSDSDTSMPADPTRSNYTFVGWSSFSDVIYSNKNENTVVTESDTWYALWKLQITFDLNYDDLGTYTTVQVAEGYSIMGDPTAVMPDDPTRQGYTFIGWANSSTSSVAERFHDSVLDGPETWYAVWQGKSVFLNFVTNDPLMGESPTSSTGSTAVVGETFTLSYNAYDGYYFNSWTEDGAGSMDGNNYTVLPADGGNTITFTANYIQNVAILTVNYHTQEATNSTGLIVTAEAGANVENGNISGTSNSAIVTYPYSASSIAVTITKANDNYDYYMSIGSVPTTSSDDDGLITYNFIANSNQTIDIYVYQKYTIKYSSGSADSGTKPASQEKIYGTAINLASNSGNLAKTGYTFDGWNTSVDGSGTSYDENESYTLNASDTLYPEFTQSGGGSSTVFVTINAGANGSVNGSSSNGEYSVNDTITLVATANGGYIFSGWSGTVSGSLNAHISSQTYTIVAGDITRGTINLTANFAVSTSNFWLDTALTPSGDGSSGSPYLIDSAEKLAWIAYQTNSGTDWSLNKYFEITADIDLSGKYWTPIGYDVTGKAFQGIMDGNNHTIYNMTIDKDAQDGQSGSNGAYLNETDEVGLFGYAETATNNIIKNLTLNNVNIIDMDYRIGALIGYSEGYDIDNIKVVGGLIEGYRYVGGLIGNFSNNGESISITNSSNTANITATDDYVGGIIGYINDYTTVSNCYNTGTIGYLDDVNTYIGGIVGYLDNDNTIINCYNTGDIHSDGYYLGGIAGHLDNNNTITNCYNTGNIETSYSNSSSIYGYIGGIFGDIYTDSLVSKCYNEGVITATGDVSYIGGLGGRAGSATVDNCYNIGLINTNSATSYVGGLIGYAYGADVSYSYSAAKVIAGTSNDGGLLGRGTGSEQYNYYNGDLATMSSSYGTEKTTAEMKMQSTYQPGTGDWDFTNIWKIETYKNYGYPYLQDLEDSIEDTPSGYWLDTALAPSGDGSSGSPYLIDSAEKLAWIAYQTNSGTDWSLNKYFEITADIDLSGKYWTPIGYDVTGKAFQGIMDGNNHTIDSVIINSIYQYEVYLQDSDNVGLFGYVESSGSGLIENLTFSNVDIYTEGEKAGALAGCVENYTIDNIKILNGLIKTGSNYAGGIAGYSSSGTEITNSYNSGSVIGEGYVGGIAGESDGSITNSYNTGNITATDNYAGGITGLSYASITNSYNTGNITATGNYVAGIVGYSYSGTEITNSYNSGNVIGEGFVGGIAGRSYALITNSYNTGDIEATVDEAGGIVGVTYEEVSYTYNVGEVTSPDDELGSLIGDIYSGGSITNSYYLDTNGVGTNGVGDGSAGTNVSVKTQVQMTTQSTFVGWDFASTPIWAMGGTINSGYPVLLGIGNFSITASAGSGGLINPSGTALYEGPLNQTFIITPNAGYEISNVVVNGVSQGAIESYTFTDNSIGGSYTISATFTVVSYTVIFEKEGGSGGSNEVTVTYGSAMPSATAPSKGGYVFSGYFDGDHGTGNQYYDANMSSMRNWDKIYWDEVNDRLYAKWVRESYTINYNENEGNPALSSEIIQYNTSMNWPGSSDISRAGYTFAGWWNSSFTTQYNWSLVPDLGANGYELNVYAKWEVNDYTITFNANGGTIESSANWTGNGGTVTKQVTYNSQVGIIPHYISSSDYTISKVGYTFIGFTIDAVSITSATTYSWVSNKIAYAQWEANNYNLTLDANGGTIESSANWTGSGASATKTVTYTNAIGTLPYYTNSSDYTISRAGYNFEGFTIDAVFITSTTTYSWASNKTAYAQWSVSAYELTLDANGGTIESSASWTGSGSTATKQVIYTNAIGTLPYYTNSSDYTISKAGYTFIGFTIDAVSITSATTYSWTSNKIAYAQWEQNTYTITYIANKPVSASNEIAGTTNASTHTYGESKALTANGYSLIGWTFNSWNALSDGTGQSYTNMQEVINLTTQNGANINLFAQWEANTYTLYFDAEGGSVTPASKQVTFDSPYGELPIPIKANDLFDGWYDNSQLEGNEVLSTDIYVKLGNQTLYAKYSFSATIIINANFNSGAESGIVAFVKVIDSTNGNIWFYPIFNSSSYTISIYKSGSFVIILTNPTGYSASVNVATFDLNQNNEEKIINIEISKTINGYLYDTYYVN